MSDNVSKRQYSTSTTTDVEELGRTSTSLERFREGGDQGPDTPDHTAALPHTLPFFNIYTILIGKTSDLERQKVTVV